MALTHLVRTPLGLCVVTLDRQGLDLGDRGGFEARWADESDTMRFQALDLETYQGVVKTHLRAVYEATHGTPPGRVALNLASHQLTDDLLGWTKLNWRA
jgi:hypothetical protein